MYPTFTPLYANFLYWSVGNAYLVILLLHVLSFLSSVPSISVKLSLSIPWWAFPFRILMVLQILSSTLNYVVLIIFMYAQLGFMYTFCTCKTKTMSKTSVFPKWRFHPWARYAVGTLQNSLADSVVSFQQAAMAVLTCGFLTSINQQND